MNSNTIKEGKTLAVLCYCTFIGLIISYIMNLEKKNEFILFHSRQMIGLVIMLIASNFVQKYGGDFLGTGLWFVTFGYWAFGIISAFRGQTIPLPFIGEHFQKWFANIK